MTIDMLDLELLQKPEQDRELRRRLWEWRTRRGWSRGAAGKRMGVSDPGLQNYEYGKRKLSNITLQRWVMSLQVPPQLHDVIAHLFLPGLVNICSGTWPPRISPAYREFINAIPYPALLLSVPDQGVLAYNAETKRISPWLADLDEAADKPVSMVVTMFSEEARKTYLNWHEQAKRTVFLFRQRGEGIIDEHIAEVRALLADQPEFERYWNTHLSPEELAQNTTMVQDPDTGEIVSYETYVFNNAFPEPEAGCLVVLMPVKRTSAEEFACVER